jgi:hypothetical protein
MLTMFLAFSIVCSLLALCVAVISKGGKIDRGTQ